MKPRTKLHYRVVQLAKDLFQISNKQKEWAYRECLEHRAYLTKNRVLCLDCGETFSPQLVTRKKALCPHCHTKVQVKESRCITDKQINYFAITEIVEDFQVIRNYEIIAYYKKGRPAKYFIHEILQYWILANGKTTMYGLNHYTMQGCDSWNGNMEIRVNPNSYYTRNKYDVYAQKYYPESIIKQEYLKYGINHNLGVLSFIEAIDLIPRNPKLETLLKAKQYELLRLQNSYNLHRYWPTLKICIRNKYKVHDHGIYIDYLELLTYFGKDLRNSKYVCPKNLKKEHDRLVAKKRERQRLEDIERQRRKIEIEQVQYEKHKKQFFGLMFSDGNITIKVLESVREFMEEGDTLKHCVFTNEYYSKEDSLILSARIGDKPIETIEVSLSKLKIVQSRGFKNEATEHNPKIVSLLKSNLHAIKRIIKNHKILA